MRHYLILVVSLSIAASAGCSSAGGGSGSGKVTGKVTFNGTPAVGARVVFCDGSSTTGPAGPSAVTDEDGRYALVGVKPGDYKVVIYKLVPKKGAVLPEDMDLEQIEASGLGSHALPSKYAKPANTTLTASVKSGSNDTPFALEGK